MSTIIGVIGLVAGVLQNINTPTTWMPSQHPTNTRVRVYAGLSGNPQESTSGNIPGVALWASSGVFIGKEMGVYNYVVDDGKFIDLEVKGKKDTTSYMSVDAFGKDGLCVAAVAVTSPTSERAGWFGDIGVKCGAPWYPSNLVIPGSDPEARPACVWIDQDNSNNHPHTGITIHLPSFRGVGLAQQYNDNLDTMCKSLPRFSMWKSRSVHMTLPVYKGGIAFNADGSDSNIDAILSPNMMQSETTAPNDPTGTKLGVADGASALQPGPVVQLGPSKRNVRFQQPLHDHLVVSNITSHSAKDLCGSSTSAGPDFVSLVESLFCDMSSKILWPICHGSSYETCFDLDDQVLRNKRVHPDLGTIEKRDFSVKSYQHVQNWQ